MGQKVLKIREIKWDSGLSGIRWDLFLKWEPINSEKRKQSPLKALAGRKLSCNDLTRGLTETASDEGVFHSEAARKWRSIIRMERALFGALLGANMKLE